MKCYKCEFTGAGKYVWRGQDKYVCANCAGISNGYKRTTYPDPSDPKKGIEKG